MSAFLFNHPSQRLRALAAGALAAGVAAASAGCREQPSADPPILLERNMYEQERYDPQSPSKFFADRASMRTPVDGTMPREAYEEDEAVATGVLADGSSYVLALPASVITSAGGLEKMARRGQQRFTIYCAPCHGATGDGQGMIARVPGGFPPLPSLTDARVDHLPDGQIFATISNGVRNMPSYGAQIPRADRWAIVAYLRALELSRLPPGEVNK